MFDSLVEGRFGADHHAAEMARFRELWEAGQVPARFSTSGDAVVMNAGAGPEAKPEDPFYSGPKFVAGSLGLEGFGVQPPVVEQPL